MQDTQRIDFANTLRGFAALFVLVSHHLGVFWFAREAIASFVNGPVLTMAALPTPGFIGWLWPVANFSWGLYGVAIFFLISGFVLPFSLATTTLGVFGFSRFMRIVPTYAVGFTFTLLAIGASTRHFGSAWTYPPHEIAIHYLPGLRDLVGTRSFDGIIWTLEIEVKFYLLCAACILLFRRYSLALFAVPVAIFASALALGAALDAGQIANATLLRLASTYLLNAQFIVFMFVGVVFHYLHVGRLAAPKAFLLALALFFLFCIQWAHGPHRGAFPQVWNYGFAALTFIFAFTYPGLFKSNRVFDFFADISYPLYVTHGVAGFVALRLLLDRGATPLMALLMVLPACVLVAWLLHRFVEAPCLAWVKAWKIKRRLHAIGAEAPHVLAPRVADFRTGQP